MFLGFSFTNDGERLVISNSLSKPCLENLKKRLPHNEQNILNIAFVIYKYVYSLCFTEDLFCQNIATEISDFKIFPYTKS